MLIGSLFSGIGGLELGVEAATGGRVAWQVERDPWCRKVLARHWPDAARFDDVCAVGSELAAVDLICGGFPCQPASVAGARKGMSDDRWLWPQFARIVGVVRPRFVFVENVAGLLTLDDGRAWGSVLGSLAALGYDAQWDVFRASDVGAPHRRERVFGLAYARGVDAQRRGRPGAVAGESGLPEGEVGQRQRGWDAFGCGRETLDVAHADHLGRGAQPVAVRDAPQHPKNLRGGGEVGYAHDSRLQGRREREGVCRVAYVAGGEVDHARMGGVPDGLSFGLDAHRWPAGRGEAQREWEPPRVGEATKGRRARLKALGNAVVPQVAALALRTLAARASVTLTTHPATLTTRLDGQSA